MSDAETGEPLSWRRRGRTSNGPPLPGASSRTRQTGGSGASALSVADRVRIARTAGTPQAMVRVLAYRRGRDAAWRTMTYVARKSDYRFVVEGDVLLEGPAVLASTLDDWARDFSPRVNARDLVHFEVSVPPGNPRDPVYRAARSFADRSFGETHQYVLAEHRDTKHPHCHVLLKLKGHDGRMLDPRKHELGRWRVAFAEAAREEGLALEASPRVARGVVRRTPPQAIYQLRRRGDVPETDLARQEAAISAARAGEAGQSPFERSVAERVNAERQAFVEAGQRLEQAARASSDPGDRAMFLGMAHDVAAYAAAMPQQRTERQELIAKVRRIDELQAKAAASTRDFDRDRDVER